MVASLDDPYSHYYDPSAYRSFLNQDQPARSAAWGSTWSRTPRAARRSTCSRTRPAARAGLQHGDVIVKVGSTSLSGRSSDFASQLIRGPAGTQCRADGRAAATRTRVVTLTRASIVVPVASGQIVTYHGDQDRPGHADRVHRRLRRRSCAPTSRKVLLGGRSGADPRPARQRRGLLDEAVNVASIFIPDGTIVSTDGRNQPRQVYLAQGDAIATSIPMVVLGRSRHGLRGRDRHRRAEGPRPCAGRGDPAPTARASFRRSSRCPTAARSTSRSASTSRPTARTSGGGGGPSEGSGISPNIYAVDTSPNAPGRPGAPGRRARGRGRSPVSPAAADRPRRGRRSRVAVIERRGKFLVAEPFFESRARGWRSAATAAPRSATWSWCARAHRSQRPARRTRDGRPPARPPRRRARRDRGADGRPWAAALVRPRRRARGARGRRILVRGRRIAAGGRRDLRTLPTFTIDPASARDFDDAISARREEARSWRIWVHIADVSAFVAPRRSGRPRGLPPRHQRLRTRARSSRCCRRRCRTRRARWCPAQDRLAVTVEMLVDGDRVVTSAFFTAR